MSGRRRTRARRVLRSGQGGDGGRALGLPQPPAPRGESPSCPPPPPGPPAAPLGPCPPPVPSHRSSYRGLSSAGPPQPRGNEPRQDPLQPQRSLSRVRGLQQKGRLSVPQAPGSGPSAPGGMESLGLPAMTLRDGTTAYLQQAARGEKLIEGQVIELEDGTTAYIHQVTIQKESVALEDGQPVVLEDGSMAYIHSTAKDSYDPGTFQAIQVRDGSTAYVHRPVIVAAGSTILEVQTGTGLEELAGEEEDDAFGVETMNALQQYSSKGSDKEEEGVTDTCRVNRMDSSNVPSQDLQEEEVHSHGKGQQVSSRAFPCGYKGCGRLYTTAHHRKVHERAHTGDRPYTCDFPSCGKAFATGYGLKSHMRIHTGEKPYKCPEDMCSKAFRTSGDLQKHIRTHTGERPFKCPFVGCGRSFTTSNIRKVHVRTHTGERPYTCPEPGCGRGFTSATNYKNHMRIHTGEKPYLCTVPGCGKRFTEYSSLYKHHVVHTHCKPYTCSSCGKTYRQTSTLAMHKRSSHGELEATEDSEWALFERLRLEVAAADRGCPLKSHHIAFLSEMEKDEKDDVVPTQVSLISQDGTEQVTVVASGAVVSEESAVAPLHHQQVALLATAHGTHITVQLEEQQSLEEGVSMAAAVIHCGPVMSDTAVSEKGS